MTKHRIDENSFCNEIIDVIVRQKEIPALESLIKALKSNKEKNNYDFKSTAIALDSNVFLRITSHHKSANIIDYLLESHPNLLVIPGQTIQEFCNNHSVVLGSISRNISKKYNELLTEVNKYKSNNIIGLDNITESLNNFKNKNEYIFDTEQLDKTIKFLDSLLNKKNSESSNIINAFAPRVNLEDIISNRKKAKTPPGFEDAGDGDFWVWIDLLWGLFCAKKQKDFDRVILLSGEKKKDWLYMGVAHPILVAEVKEILEVDFEIWNIDDFSKAIEQITE